MTSTTRGRSKATDTPMSSESQGEGAAPLQEAAGDIADQATHTADVKASNAMTQMGDALEQVAKAARDAAQSLREQRPEVANVVETAASKAEEAATYLREHNAREFMSTAEQTARKQPGLVIAGGLALGLVAARFLRSASGPARRGPGSRAVRRERVTARGPRRAPIGTTLERVPVPPGSSADDLGTRPYSMGASTAGQSESGHGNGSGSQDAYRLAELGSERWTNTGRLTIGVSDSCSGT